MPKPADNTVSEAFLLRLTDAQCDLHAYLTYLVGNREEAKDVLQETNIVLWREASRYDEGRPFLPWAKTVAYYQALTHIEKRARDRLVFDEDLLLLLATADERHHDGMEARLRLLDVCFNKLTRLQQSLIRFRYFHNWPVRRLAEKYAFSANSVSMLLTRIRRQLALCVEAGLKKEAGG
jgi:RNA polymerase sigma-70 factor (ECF subfamily)